MKICPKILWKRWSPNLKNKRLKITKIKRGVCVTCLCVCVCIFKVLIRDIIWLAITGWIIRIIFFSLSTIGIWVAFPLWFFILEVLLVYCCLDMWQELWCQYMHTVGYEEEKKGCWSGGKMASSKFTFATIESSLTSWDFKAFVSSSRQDGNF